ncbi:MAG: hypothetical protein JWM52_774, partial [Candidatus Saccharibacteria bacterium]|nr:hypothetical protein [Candidatus Saccharibacteria bacterium]
MIARGAFGLSGFIVDSITNKWGDELDVT